MSKLYTILGEVLKEDPARLHDDSSPQTVENWDSFNGLLLASRIEKEFKIEFTMEEILDVKDVRDIKRHLKNHGIDPDV